jgi:hypothetical protein
VIHDALRDIPVSDLKVLEKLLLIRETRITFAQDHHVNTRGERMEFSQYPHIRDLYNSTAPELVLQGSVQCFKSEWAVIDQFACAYTGLSVFVVVPKYEIRNTYVQNRVNRCVENVPEYKKIIGSGFFDSVALKSFGPGTIKYVSSNSLADFKEYPADVLIVEEVDECNDDNLGYAQDRLRASPYQFRRYIGNPKISGHGINALYNTSDQREWFVPCLSCGKYSMVDWFKTVVTDIRDKDGAVVEYRLRDSDWAVGCRRDIRMICPECGGILDRGSIAGRWEPQNPNSSVEGYHISMMCAPVNSLASMWARFQRAVIDPGLLQKFYNSDLGLPYTAIGNKLSQSLLDTCTRDYHFEVGPDYACVPADSDPGPCSMGVDVGGVLDVRISHIGDRGTRRAVFIGKVKRIDDLHDLILRYNVEKVVIDSMPEATLVQDFQETAFADVWACRYVGDGTDKRRKYDTVTRTIHIDRTEALDRSFAKIRQQKNLLPKNYASILGGHYVSEMCVPVRGVVEDSSGNMRYEWSSGVDHQRHCDTYDMLAADLMADSVIDEVSIE